MSLFFFHSPEDREAHWAVSKYSLSDLFVFSTKLFHTDISFSVLGGVLSSAFFWTFWLLS